MVLDDTVFMLAYFTGFAENLGRHRHLTDIVEKPSNVNTHYLPLGKAHLLGDRPRQLSDPPLMAGCIGVTAFYHQRHGVDNAIHNSLQFGVLPLNVLVKVSVIDAGSYMSRNHLEKPSIFNRK